ncbi:Transmembrane protein 245 [Manis javanica]|nr:Transmembrane protein 245 [Manis javanica]
MGLLTAKGRAGHPAGGGGSGPSGARLSCHLARGPRDRSAFKTAPGRPPAPRRRLCATTRLPRELPAGRPQSPPRPAARPGRLAPRVRLQLSSVSRFLKHCMCEAAW